jgi:hypothetical protein
MKIEAAGRTIGDLEKEGYTHIHPPIAPSRSSLRTAILLRGGMIRRR